MTPERWRQVEEVYQAAMDRERGLRDAWLAEACGQSGSAPALHCEHRIQSDIKRHHVIEVLVFRWNHEAVRGEEFVVGVKRRRMT